MVILARRLLREHERERQAWERERKRLVETICHLAEKPLPTDPYPEPNGIPDYAEIHGLVPDIEQHPDY